MYGNAGDLPWATSSEAAPESSHDGLVPAASLLKVTKYERNIDLLAYIC
jgi:hypothetical protein